jgi:hypothetical protein
MTRYIFLDFDGVISTDRNNLGRKDLGLPVRDELGPLFDANAVDNLNRLVDATDADIIITSSWKYLGFDAMWELWKRRSMPGFLRGITPDVTGGYMFKRGMEIARWLHDNTCDDPQSYRYVIVDDGDDFLPEQIPFAVFTNPRIGLSAEDADRAIAILTE